MEPDASPQLRAMSDGVITLRPPTDSDRAAFLAGRDDALARWLGPGDDDPRPTAAIVVSGDVVGWVDYAYDGEWLADGEVNLGYNFFPAHRGHGYATRAVELLMRHLADCPGVHTATLSIDRDNAASIAVAAKTGFSPAATDRPQLYFKRPTVRPRSGTA